MTCFGYSLTGVWVFLSPTAKLLLLWFDTQIYAHKTHIWTAPNKWINKFWEKKNSNKPQNSDDDGRRRQQTIGFKVPSSHRHSHNSTASIVRYVKTNKWTMMRCDAMRSKYTGQMWDVPSNEAAFSSQTKHTKWMFTRTPVACECNLCVQSLLSVSVFMSPYFYAFECHRYNVNNNTYIDSHVCVCAVDHSWAHTYICCATGPKHSQVVNQTTNTHLCAVVCVCDMLLLFIYSVMCES